MTERLAEEFAADFASRGEVGAAFAAVRDDMAFSYTPNCLAPDRQEKCCRPMLVAVNG